MIDVFIEILDGLFWEGYAQQLANENPKAFNHEYTEFLSNTAL
jgi:hypothetical protein